MVKLEDENQEKKEEERDNEASKDESTHDPYFAPVVNLPEMEVRLLFNLNVVECRGISILGEVRNVEISRVTQQLLHSCSFMIPGLIFGCKPS